jgi:hypothetical protein
VKFPTAEIKDTEGNTWHQEEGRLRRLNQGVEGAHLCTSFQCELCWFRNLTGKDPTPGVHDMAIRCLCRCNLDNFAGRAPSTIRGHKLEIFTLLKKFESVGMPLLLQPLGPLPVGDKVGMGIALGMQLKSITAKGRIVDSVQFATLHLYPRLIICGSGRLCLCIDGCLPTRKRRLLCRARWLKATFK